MNTPRCIVCLSPVSRSWHRYCRTCRAWLRFAHALAIIRTTREAREPL